ncbi:hypothetical protein DINM_001945 [Dirofilaria immitis]|nr:hypothetical protein [Dirofilaria immitis]
MYERETVVESISNELDGEWVRQLLKMSSSSSSSSLRDNNKDVVPPQTYHHHHPSSQIASLSLPITNTRSSSSSSSSSSTDLSVETTTIAVAVIATTTTTTTTTVAATTTTTTTATAATTTTTTTTISITEIGTENETERIIGTAIGLTSLPSSVSLTGAAATISYMDMDQKPPSFQDYSTTSVPPPPPPPPPPPQQQHPPPQSLYNVGPSNCYNPLQSSASTTGSSHDFNRGTAPMSSYFYQNSFPTSASAAVAVAAAATVSGTPYGAGAAGTAPHFMYHQQSASSPEGNYIVASFIEDDDDDDDDDVDDNDDNDDH